jgi:nitrite reductase (NADH) small subunit
MKWYKVCGVDEIPVMGARTVRYNGLEAGLFRLSDGRVKAVENRCPHKGGPLSEGIVSGETVICPMHGLKINLVDGSVLPPDEGNVKTYEIKTEDEKVWIML